MCIVYHTQALKVEKAYALGNTKLQLSEEVW